MNIHEIDGGWRVAETATHWIDVHSMMFNYRVVNTPKDFPEVYESGFCYVGKDQVTFLRAVAAAMLWAEEGAAEPRYWNKNVKTGEWRDNETLVAGDLPDTASGGEERVVSEPVHVREEVRADGPSPPRGAEG